MERLSKYLARCGIASRRKAEELILDKKVKVNGQTVSELGTKIDPEKDKVSIDGLPIKEPQKVYYLLNKPKGYNTTAKDPYAKKTVLDLLPQEERIFPVGRLDKYTTGLIILTNDGELTNKLIHPRYEKEKEYEVVCSLQLAVGSLEKLEKGVIIDGKKTKPAKVKFIKKTNDKYLYSITIKEGRKRQIRLMFAKIGHPVLELERIRMDFLTLGSLKEGSYRTLTEKEVKKLYEDKK